MEILLNSLIILITGIIIYVAGNHFTHSSSNLGDYLRLPRSVKGATFDAIASSFPELMVATFSVIAFKRFEVGIGTIAGSALFNILVIPGICVFVAPVVFKVSKEVVYRDAVYYLVATFLLLSLLMLFSVWGIIIGLLLLGFYLIYIRDVVKDTRSAKNIAKKDINLTRELMIVIITMIIIGFSTYYLTESAISLAENLSIPPFVIAFTVIAAATSIPDAIISIVNARKGDVDDAASNVFGSNIFDILVGLSIPLLLAYIFSGPALIIFENVEIILGLMGSTILIIYMLAKRRTLTKLHGLILLAIYAAFVIYAFMI